MVETPGGRSAKSEDQPHAKQITDAPQPAVRGEDTTREPMQVAGDAEREVPDARRAVTRAAERQ